MKQLKRKPKRSGHALKLGVRFKLLQRLAGTIFGPTHAVVAVQCCCPLQTLHEVKGATGLSRNIVDVVLHDFHRAGLGTYQSRIFRPADDGTLHPTVNRVSRAQRAGVK